MISGKKRIIILTKSSKYGGLCVAGVDFNTGDWIRLVKKGGGQITKKNPCRFSKPNKIKSSMFSSLKLMSYYK